MVKKAAIIGAGAWGTALATAIDRAGVQATLWAREHEVVADINNSNENSAFLAGIALSKNIKATDDFADILDNDVLFLVAPAQFLGATCSALKEAGLGDDKPLILCSKGIEKGSLKLMTEVVGDVLPKNPIAVLSGPTFASEVAKGLPASVTLACEDENLCKNISSYIGSSGFKVFLNNDIIGAEIGGAVKNVIAIACGIAQGSGLGENAKAALIVRGVREMKRLCEEKGGDPDTLMHLCGVGDLVLTATSQESRNFSLGYALGKGEKLDSIMAKRNSVAEGVASSQSVVELAKKLGVELPICDAVNKIVHGKADINHTLEALIQGS